MPSAVSIYYAILNGNSIRCLCHSNKILFRVRAWFRDSAGGTYIYQMFPRQPESTFLHESIIYIDAIILERICILIFVFFPNYYILIITILEGWY